MRFDMKIIKISTLTLCTALGFLMGCTKDLEELAEDFGIVETSGSHLRWAEEGTTILTVKGNNYVVTKIVGRDLKTHEIFVVQYKTVIDGNSVICGVGSLERCREGIEKKLEPPEFEAGD